MEQRVVGEVDARHDVLRAEGDLLCLGEEIVDAAVEHQPADAAYRHLFLRNDLGGIEDVKCELVGEIVVEQLHPQLPFGEIAALDRVPQIAAMKVGVGAIDLERLVPYHGLQAELRLPVKLDESRFAPSIDHPEGMDAEPFHEFERARIARSDIAHISMCVDSGISDTKSQKLSCALCACGKPRSGSSFTAWNRSGNFIASWMKKTGMLLPTSPSPLPGVKLDREAAHVAREIGGTFAARDGREAHESRRLLAGALEDVGAGDVGERLVSLEKAMRAKASRMDDALRNALMVEVEDLVAQHKVFEQCRTARAGFQRVLVVGDRRALLRRQHINAAPGRLMGLPASPACDFSIRQFCF